MSLNEVIGQGRAVKILSSMIKRDRIAASFLFSGISGIGKRFTAMQFSKTINCKNEASVKMGMSCDICNSCRKINFLTHPDIKIISPFNSSDDKKLPVITIDEIRTINEFLSYTPSEGRKKVVIIDDADSMTTQAGNALLKTLEEPSSNSIIILISSSEANLLDTIISRCIKISFVPLSTSALKTILDKTGEDLSSDQVRIYRGSLEGFEGRERELNRDKGIETLQDIIKGKGFEKWKEREDMEEWFENIIPILRDMVVSKIDGSDDFLINIDIKDEIKRLTKKTNLENMVKCFDKVYETSRKMYLNPNKAIIQNYMNSVIKDMLKSDPIHP